MGEKLLDAIVTGGLWAHKVLLSINTPLRKTMIVALMHGGEPVALEVNDAFPSAPFLHHAKQPPRHRIPSRPRAVDSGSGGLGGEQRQVGSRVHVADPQN